MGLEYVIGTTVITVGTVYVLTEIGKSNGMPAPLSFVIVMACLFGVFILKMKA